MLIVLMCREMSHVKAVSEQNLLKVCVSMCVSVSFVAGSEDDRVLGVN